MQKHIQKSSYVRQGVCQGHGGALRHIDFSSNSQFISSACDNNALLFWDIRGNAIKNGFVLILLILRYCLY